MTGYTFFTRSNSAAFGSFALIIPDARSTPSAPSSTAAATSSPVEIPAPHNTLTSGFILLTALTEPLTISGLAFETGIPEPISSGGSIATKSGPSTAAADVTAILFVQTTVLNPAFFAYWIAESISDNRILRSE